MTYFQRCIALGAIAVLTVSVFASNPSYSKIGSITLGSLAEKQIECKTHGLEVPKPTSTIQLYKVRYGTLDTHGSPVTVSGLLILPKSAPKGLLLYFHGTIRD